MRSSLKSAIGSRTSGMLFFAALTRGETSMAVSHELGQISEALLQVGNERMANLCVYIDNWPIKHGCGWHLCFPLHARSIDGHEVPQMIVVNTTLLRRLGGTRVLCHPSREDVTFVPELGHAMIGQSLENNRHRLREVGRQHRFPDRKYANIEVGILAQDLFNCRGPLQACRSSRR
jgi:hypothetical protein